MKPTTQLGVLVLGVLTAICTVLAAFDLVTTADAGIIEAWAGTSLVGVLVIWAHFDPRLPKEPVALGAWIVTETTVTLVSLNGLHVWEITDAQQAVLVGLVVSLVAIVSGYLVRQVATPWPKGYPYPEGGPIAEGAFNPPPNAEPGALRSPKPYR